MAPMTLALHPLTSSCPPSTRLPIRAALTFPPPNKTSKPQVQPPAPQGPFSAALAALIGTDPNGLWSLYVFDDSSGDFGNIANGWSLTLSAATPLYKPTDLSVAGVASPASVRVGNYFTNTF